MSYQVAQAIRSGLAKNKSLVDKLVEYNPGVDFLEEVLFGLCDHISLKTRLERNHHESALRFLYISTGHWKHSF
jgi:hypothetical protein